MLLTMNTLEWEATSPAYCIMDNGLCMPVAWYATCQGVSRGTGGSKGGIELHLENYSPKFI